VAEKFYKTGREEFLSDFRGIKKRQTNTQGIPTVLVGIP
jgi:hypothetical protein